MDGGIFGVNPTYRRLARWREDRLATFCAGRRYDPATHFLVAAADLRPRDSGGRPREVIAIVPHADRDATADLDAAGLMGRYPTLVVPVEFDFWALLEAGVG